MKVYKSSLTFASQKKVIATIGMFDGVHIGHQKIIALLESVSKNIDGESTLLTFSPHPRIALGKAEGLKLLQTEEEKIQKLQKLSLDNLVLQKFDLEFAKLSAEDFVKNILVDRLNIHTLIIGHDHQFGKNREGNFESLQKFSYKYNFKLEQLPAINVGNTTISSTKIRNALFEGNIPFANSGLGENYCISGIVVKGKQIGRTIGFPTANLQTAPYKLIPKNGVYAVLVEVQNAKHKGVLNIGMRPTVDGKSQTIEVHLLDFKGDLYGQKISIELLEFIRNEMKFENLEELKSQIQKDIHTAKDHFTSI